MTEEQFADLLGIVDEAAGKAHRPSGSVAATLHKVLARYDEMRTGAPCESMVAARALLGREVAVTLSRDPEVIVAGRLVSVSEAGEVGLIDSDGFARWCWPMLDIREAPDGPTPTP